MDFKNALSAFSVSLIDKESASVSRAIQYILSRTNENLILVCHSMGGVVCLNVLSQLSEETLKRIKQVIFLNSPLTQHPLNSNTAFQGKYKQMYKTLKERKHLLDEVHLLSFTSGSSDNQVAADETHLRLQFKNSIHLRTQDLRDVFVTLHHDDILTYTPFLSLLSKYFLMDTFYNSFNQDINVIKHFFTHFDIHYEDQINRNYFSFSKQDLDSQCASFIPKFEQQATFNLLKTGKKLNFKPASLPKDQTIDPRSFLNKENLLCVKIQTQNIRASNLIYYMRTNIPSQNIKVFTFRHKNLIKYKYTETRSTIQQVDDDETQIFDTDLNIRHSNTDNEDGISSQSDTEQQKIKQSQSAIQNSLEIKEIFPEFSYFFSTAYLQPHLLQYKEIYLVYTIRNDTYLQREYQQQFNQTFAYTNLFFSIFNYQDSDKNTHLFNKIKKEEWKSKQQVMKAKIEPSDEVYLYKYCTSASGSLFSWLSNDQTKQVQFKKWNRNDYNILILKDLQTSNRIHISFSYGENDCDFVDIFNTQNKDITFIHDKINEEISTLFSAQGSISQSQKKEKYDTYPLLLSQENNIGEYARSIGKYGKIIILNMHIILCCMLISIQMKYYEPTCFQDAPSHISIICDNFSKIILCEGLAIFSILQLQKYLFYDGMRKQANFLHHNLQPVEYFASSLFMSFIITFATISTYILCQFVFQVFSFFTYLVCSLFRYLILNSSIIQSLIKSRYFYFINALTLLVPLLFLTNYHLKWVILFVIFWILLGIMQANHSQFGHTINIMHGFAYLILLHFVLNIHNLLTGHFQLKNLDRSFKNLEFTEEFTNEFFTMVCWLYILTKSENLVSSMRNPLQIIFILLSLFLLFFTFQSVSFANDYLCNLSYLLTFFTIYYHNYKSPQITPYPQQQQQQ